MTQSESPHHGRSWRRTALASVLLAGTALGGFAAGHVSFAATASNSTAQPSAAVTQSNGTLVNPSGQSLSEHLLPSFVGLVEKVKPAVVSITTKLTQSASQNAFGQNGAMPQLPFPFNQMFPHHPPIRAVEARGSGFIIDSNGTIVTNNHVIKGEKSVTVTLDNGATYPAKVIGRDPRTDIAVLRIDVGHKLPYLHLGNSKDVKPGQWVVAMGNPFGLGGTVTHGIVSAISRNIGDGPYDQFIQTDAPINKGNSGGPLFTQEGKVIGMNTAILSPSGGSIGIGFAIPSNLIRNVVDQLETHGHVVRGYIGVEVQALKGATAKALGLQENSGALLAAIEPNTPASRAGLQAGDVIQQVNGQAVHSPHDLAVDIAAIPPGQPAHLKVLRNGAMKDITLNVEQMPNHLASNGSQGAEQGHAQIGLALEPLTSGLRGQLDVPPGEGGAVIRGVQPGSPAAMAGLQPGDVIVGVNMRPVHSVSQTAHAIRSAISGKDHAVALRVMRNGQAMFVGVGIGNQG